jgi:RNA polymerase sigma factor for flagellar operon FliA
MSSLASKLKNLKDYRCTVDPKVKDQIIVEYAPLVRFIAQKIAARLPANIELDDLISCGVIGLMDAIQKFDPTRDNKFKTYAEFRIRGAILDELRSQDWVPRSIREKTKQLEKAYAKLERELGRPATDDEMCDELECSIEEFHELLNKSKSVSLLNIDDSASFNRGDKKLMMGLLEHRRSSNPFAAVNYKRAQQKIKEGIKALPEKQRLVLSLYYFEDLNLKEIGQVLDVTESRVSQLHTQAILKLKVKLRNDFESHEDIAV